MSPFYQHHHCRHFGSNPPLGASIYFCLSLETSRFTTLHAVARRRIQRLLYVAGSSAESPGRRRLVQNCTGMRPHACHLGIYRVQAGRRVGTQEAARSSWPCVLAVRYVWEPADSVRFHLCRWLLGKRAVPTLLPWGHQRVVARDLDRNPRRGLADVLPCPGVAGRAPMVRSFFEALAAALALDPGHHPEHHQCGSRLGCRQRGSFRFVVYRRGHVGRCCVRHFGHIVVGGRRRRPR